jgi:hypothetical protein
VLAHPLPDPIDATREEPGLLRAVAVGSGIGAVAAMVAVGGALVLSGHGSSAALGIGGMAAFWGGLGFGSMLGGVLHLQSAEEAQPPR